MEVLITFPDSLLGMHPRINFLISSLSLKFTLKDEIIHDDYLKYIGKILWRIIFKYNDLSDSILTGKVDFILYSTSQDIQKIPWEISYDDKFGFIGINKKFTFSRTFFENKSIENNYFNKINSLHISINSNIDSKKEFLNISNSFKNSNHSIRFITNNLLKSIVEYRPNILIVSGHGEYKYEPHLSSISYYKINDDNIDMIKLLSGIDNKYLPTMVIMNTCESSKNTSSNINDSNVCKFLDLGVLFYIGMREPILDSSAINFISLFLYEMIHGNNVFSAMQFSRSKMVLPMKGIYHDIRKDISYGQWAIPEIYIGKIG